MAKNPLLYEINTRCWLRELSEQAGRPLTLAEAPESQFEQWEALGFTHIWLMGVWPTGPLAREHALKNPYLRKRYDELLPGWESEDIGGSPYSIEDYRVASALGGEKALAVFRERLRRHGLKLVLDFVPNHLGIDHMWLRKHPERFVLADQFIDGTFPAKSPGKTFRVAHGRDPYFDPWTDTAQLDYRRAETRAAMNAELQRIAEQCDGVRCDMAMLVLKDVFGKTWEKFPVAEKGEEFWPGAISAARRKQPEFLFLAEAYWGTEEKLRRQGFDYCYDKEWYDHLMRLDGPAMRQHLAEKPATFHRHAARFLENHDERRVSGFLTVAQHRAAAVLLMSMPGLRLIHEGQMEGWTEQIPVQMARRPRRVVKADIARLYTELLRHRPESPIGRGRWEVLKVEGENNGAECVIAILWKGRGARDRCEIVAVNWSERPASGRVVLEAFDVGEWKVQDLMGGDGNSLALELPAYGVRVLRVDQSTST